MLLWPYVGHKPNYCVSLLLLDTRTGDPSQSLSGMIDYARTLRPTSIMYQELDERAISACCNAHPISISIIAKLLHQMLDG